MTQVAVPNKLIKPVDPLLKPQMMLSRKEHHEQDIILSDILYIHNKAEQSWIVYLDNHTQRCYSTPQHLNRWEKKLPGFWRINESYLINPNLIYKFHPAELPHFPLPLVELITGRCFAVSRQKRELIQQKWNQLQHSILS